MSKKKIIPAICVLMGFGFSAVSLAEQSGDNPSTNIQTSEMCDDKSCTDVSNSATVSDAERVHAKLQLLEGAEYEKMLNPDVRRESCVGTPISESLCEQSDY